MKKALWWTAGLLLSPVLLFLILAALLYLPPVQNWAVDKVAAIASEKTGMDISVGHVNLEWPLDLGIDDFLELLLCSFLHIISECCYTVWMVLKG